MALEKSLFKKPNIELEGSDPIPVAGIEGDVCTTCSECKKMLFSSQLKDNLFICIHCGHYIRVTARDRIAMIADEGSFSELFEERKSQNPIDFPSYDAKLKRAMENSGENEAVLTGTCEINGVKTAIFVMDAAFLMGSMGCVVGDKVASIFEYATQHNLSVLGYTVSGGARMQEGILSLMQMAKVSAAVKVHSDAGLFYLTVLTDPTTGGVTASFAMQGDIILSEPRALVGFAGPRVIEQTIRQTLPEGFQRAELLVKLGFVDAILERDDAKEVLHMLLEAHTKEGA